MSHWPNTIAPSLGEKKCKEVDFEEELQVFHKFKESRTLTSTASSTTTPVSLLSSDLDVTSNLKKNNTNKPPMVVTGKPLCNTKSNPRVVVVQNHTIPPSSSSLSFLQLQQLRCALTYVQTSLHHEPLLYNQEATFEEQAQQLVDHAAVSIIQMVRKVKELESKLDLQDKKWKDMEQFIQTIQLQQQNLETLLMEKTSSHSEMITALQAKQDELTKQYQPLIQAQTSLIDEVLGNIESSYFCPEQLD